MSVSGSRFKLILLAVVMCSFTLNVYTATKHKPKPAKQEQPAPPPAIVEVPTPAELTLEQKPAVPPKVTYQDRQLTIVAENSSLGDVLRAVKTQTGASIDLPANTNARIVTHLGPGPSRDVIAQLLNGTLFNYVLLGTVNDPAAVGKIILIPKPMAGATESAANVQPNMQQQQQNYPAVNMPNQNGEEADPDVETNTATEEDNSPNVPETEQPAATTAPNGAQQPNLRTPEQLLQELQRQQQLQQQLQQQQQGTPQPNQQPEQNPPQ